jgi:hypothetical protein
MGKLLNLGADAHPMHIHWLPLQIVFDNSADADGICKPIPLGFSPSKRQARFLGYTWI